MSFEADCWPFMRQDPDCVVLDVRPGAAASDKPPVRIFLGTEEAQYRAERVFFYSIEQVRDPGRVYEIHLMKNLDGFNRKGWRTGFTNYRYAIPSLAGGTGKAIYNDVDQIYLADPALLFDLEMGEHGFLAIHAKDTSVMLIDCARMLPIWNREAASTKGKKELTNAPDSNPSLYGFLDGHWNARDVEYVEGMTKCLHYTALHQQPWEPFPGTFSYHPNPLAYIWHELDEKADQRHFELFSNDRPSPELTRRHDADNKRSRHAEGLDLLANLGVQSALFITAGGDDFQAPGVDVRRFQPGAGEPWPEGSFDLVLIDGLFDNLPPIDIGWILDNAFSSTGKLLWMAVQATEREDPELGSADWWHQRLEYAAKAHPDIAYRLDISGVSNRSFQSSKQPEPGAPTVWALVGPGRNQDVAKLVHGLGWNFQNKVLSIDSTPLLPAFLRKPGLDGLTENAARSISEPWPDLVVAGSPKLAPVARWIKDQSQGKTKLVQIGRPGAPFSIFDLILASPDDRLPIRPNVLQTAASLGPITHPPAHAGTKNVRDVSLLYLSEPGSGFLLPTAKLDEFCSLIRDLIDSKDGVLTVAIEQDCSEELVKRFKAAFDREINIIDLRDGESNADGAFQLAARAIVLGPNLERLARIVTAQKPAYYMALPKWHETIPVIRQIAKLLGLLTGGGRTYRGTPYQQHLIGRFIDRLATMGISILPRDYTAYHQALRARGLLFRLDNPAKIATPKPLADLDAAVTRIRRIMAETVSQS